MRVRATTPIRVGEAELARRLERYRALSPPSVEVDLADLPAGAPESLESERDIRASERSVVEEALATDPAARYDTVMPDCVLDPGLDRLEEVSPVPVFGILKLSAGILVSLGHRFATVTRNRPIGEELRARLRRYGYLGNCEENVVLDLDLQDIADDARWNRKLAGAAGRFAGTTAVINGCSAVELHPGQGSAAAMIDPTKLALSLIGTAAITGLATRPREDLSSGERGV